MGYETKIIIGHASASVSDEWARTKKKYKDGSGFEIKKDRKGNTVYTGRKEHWFHHYATVDLSKLGYAKDALNAILRESHKTANEQKDRVVHFYFADDGNTHIAEDKYGDAMWPIPIRDFLVACKASADATSYRRLKWAIALLESMADDSEGLSVLAFGH